MKLRSVLQRPAAVGYFKIVVFNSALQTAEKHLDNEMFAVYQRKLHHSLVLFCVPLIVSIFWSRGKFVDSPIRGKIMSDLRQDHYCLRRMIFCCEVTSLTSQPSPTTGLVTIRGTPKVSETYSGGVIAPR